MRAGFGTVGRCVELLKVGSFCDDVSVWDGGNEGGRAFDCGVKGLELGDVERAKVGNR